MASGYTNCACRDCFDETVSDDEAVPELCSDCEEAGCDADGSCECRRDDAYGQGDEEDDGIVAVTAPASWAPYLMSGDGSGLEEQDVRDADRMVKSLGEGDIVGCSEVGFRSSPVYGLPGECCEYTFLPRDP